MFKAYYYNNKNNCGDLLSIPVLEFVLNCKIKKATRKESGKILAIGSIMSVLKNEMMWK